MGSDYLNRNNSKYRLEDLKNQKSLLTFMMSYIKVGTPFMLTAMVWIVFFGERKHMPFQIPISTFTLFGIGGLIFMAFAYYVSSLIIKYTDKQIANMEEVEKHNHNFKTDKKLYDKIEIE